MGLTASSIRVMAASLTLCLVSHAAFAQAEGAAAPDVNSIVAARKHLDLGMKLYAEHNMRAALVEMTRAYEIAPSARLLFNIGQTALEAKDFAAAYTTLTRYLASEPADLTPARRQLVERELAEASARVGFLILETDVVGAESTIDGVSVSLGSERIPLESGRHEVSVVGHDGSRLSRVVDISVGDSTRVRLVRPSEPPAPTRAATRAPTPPAKTMGRPVQPALVPSASRPWVWAGVAATGGLGVSGVVLGLITQKAKADHEALLRVVPGDSAQIESSARSVRTSALTTDILFGAALLSGATTLTLYLLEGGSPRQRNLSVDVGAGQLRVTGRF